LELAAAAEDAAREACRSSAKQIFAKRKETISVAEEGFNLPRPWFVSSYFSGYEQLSVALSLFKFASESLNNAKSVEDKFNKSDLGDIDEESIYSSGLMQTPDFFVDETANSVNGQAYSLLVVLSELFECSTYDVRQNDISEELSYISSAVFVAADSIYVAPIKGEKEVSKEMMSNTLPTIFNAGSAAVSSACLAESMSSLVQIDQHSEIKVAPIDSQLFCGWSTLGLLWEGECLITTYAELDSNSDQDAVLPSTQFSTALKLLLGEADEIDCFTNDVLPPEFVNCNAVLLKFLSSMTKDQVVELTGVSFNPNGSVQSVLKFAGDLNNSVLDEDECEENWYDSSSDDGSDSDSSTEWGTVSDSEAECGSNECDASESADLPENSEIAAMVNDLANVNLLTKLNIEPLKVSHKLRARLLSICGSVSYLSGDAIGAVECFRESLVHDPRLLDTYVKLGSLLVDMDDMTEVLGFPSHFTFFYLVNLFLFLFLLI
jgi:hypothetical protein